MVQLNTTLSPSIQQGIVGRKPGSPDPFATGDVTIAAGDAADEDTVTLIDALGGTQEFEFESVGGLAGTGIEVLIGVDNVETAQNLADAINSTGILITASAAAGVVTLTQDRAGPEGNTTITVSGVNLSKNDFTGGTADQNVMIFERIGATGDILCSAVNESKTENLVIRMEQGDLNTDADYAAENVLVDGSAVATVTVLPAGQRTFVIAGPGLGSQGPGVEGSVQGGFATRFFRIIASDSREAHGAVSLTYYGGSLERRRLFG